jgi:hypothetical protein
MRRLWLNLIYHLIMFQEGLKKVNKTSLIIIGFSAEYRRVNVPYTSLKRYYYNHLHRACAVGLLCLLISGLFNDAIMGETFSNQQLGLVMIIV